MQFSINSIITYLKLEQFKTGLSLPHNTHKFSCVQYAEFSFLKQQVSAYLFYRPAMWVLCGSESQSGPSGNLQSQTSANRSPQITNHVGVTNLLKRVLILP